MKHNLLSKITTGFAILGLLLLFLKVGKDVNNEMISKASNLKMGVSMSISVDNSTAIKVDDKPKYDTSKENIDKWQQRTNKY